MSTILFDEMIFGPVESRRFGISLGINLLSSDIKVCNFDCIYCECGYSHYDLQIANKFTSETVLLDELNHQFKAGKYEALDAITYAGNGEPTLHPHFDSIARSIKLLRDKYHPNVKIVLLTNGSTLSSKRFKNAAPWIDEICIKLDAGNQEFFDTINHPLGKFTLSQLVESIKSLEIPITIQSIFFRGMVNGNQFDNSDPKHVNAWLELIREIRPELVMIYSISRDTALESLEAISKIKLDNIAAKVHKLDINTLVS